MFSRTSYKPKTSSVHESGKDMIRRRTMTAQNQRRHRMTEWPDWFFMDYKFKIGWKSR